MDIEQQTSSSKNEQARIIKASVDAKLLVTAGPGTGKTYVLIRRVQELIDRGLAPGGDLLILSFSRAAVYEIICRIRETENRTRFVRSNTFDSFATQLLASFDPNGIWSTNSNNFDDRIENATDLIKNNKDTVNYLGRFSHLFVDELQDLTGVRIEFVKAIINNIAGGFTLLGDPAQGIYSFSLNDKDRNKYSSTFYEWVREAFLNELKEYSLSHNHRVKTKKAEISLWAGNMLNKPCPDYETIKSNLETNLLSLQELDQPDQVISFLEDITGKTAILCRTNGEALLVSKNLWDSNIPHYFQRRATERVLPKWIGTVFCKTDQIIMGRSTFKEIYENIEDISTSDFSESWNSIKRIEKSPARDMVELRRLSRHINIGLVPDDLYERHDAKLIVSTIHRAKGREFDRVIICNRPRYILRTDTDIGEEARILYVALTRTNQELYSLKMPPIDGLIRLDKITKRWILTSYRGFVVDLEISGGDTDDRAPFVSAVDNSWDASTVQDYLKNQITPGDEVMLVNTSKYTKTNKTFSFEILHNERMIGSMSPRFDHDLNLVLALNKRQPDKPPSRIENLRIETVDTVAGTTGMSRVYGLGESDIWLRVRIAGLGHMVFENICY